MSGEDFYTILGVNPDAETKDIKKAYYNLMREVHPDRSDDEYSTQLCAVLNEIYEVLSDEERRRTYDIISGFSPESENPFMDVNYPRDQVFVDEITCIGCGKCARVCPSNFIIEGSKYGRARVISQEIQDPVDIEIAIESCPVDCIHWVSTPQLSLLEAALSTMARVEVYIMMRYGRSTGEDVFQIASKAWEKRMEKYRRKAEQIFDWGSLSFRERSAMEGEEGEPHMQPQDKESRRIANLAAAAARAARLWRSSERAVVVRGLIGGDGVEMA